MHRLYSKAVILGYKRGQRHQEPQVSLVKIDGVNTKEDARYYFGKRVAYVYKAKRATKNKVTGRDTRYRVRMCTLSSLHLPWFAQSLSCVVAHVG